MTPVTPSSLSRRYCSFCRSPLRVYAHKKAGWTAFFLSGALALCLSFMAWGKLHPRLLVAWVLFFALSEVFVQIRWRLSTRCGVCGFDPSLYLKDAARAADRVKNHLEKRRDDGKENPLITLPALPFRRPDQ